tara:strand:+ start:79 stop:522 length:444 start_codon:yes stop_codon:yes gene_type:complete
MFRFGLLPQCVISLEATMAATAGTVFAVIGNMSNNQEKTSKGAQPVCKRRKLKTFLDVRGLTTFLLTAGSIGTGSIGTGSVLCQLTPGCRSAALVSEHERAEGKERDSNDARKGWYEAFVFSPSRHECTRCEDEAKYSHPLMEALMS